MPLKTMSWRRGDRPMADSCHVERRSWAPQSAFGLIEWIDVMTDHAMMSVIVRRLVSFNGGESVNCSKIHDTYRWNRSHWQCHWWWWLCLAVWFVLCWPLNSVNFATKQVPILSQPLVTSDQAGYSAGKHIASPKTIRFPTKRKTNKRDSRSVWHSLLLSAVDLLWWFSVRWSPQFHSISDPHALLCHSGR